MLSLLLNRVPSESLLVRRVALAGAAAFGVWFVLFLLILVGANFIAGMGWESY